MNDMQPIIYLFTFCDGIMEVNYIDAQLVFPHQKIIEI